MNRFCCVIVMVVMTVCVLGLAPLAASEIVEIDEIEVQPEMSTKAPGAISDYNYIKEVYTSTEPATGESYNEKATKVFSSGESIHLVTRYYMGHSSSRTIYRILSTPEGVVQYFLPSTHGASGTGHYVNDCTLSGISPGSYTLTTMIFVSDWNTFISSPGFNFFVE